MIAVPCGSSPGAVRLAKPREKTSVAAGLAFTSFRNVSPCLVSTGWPSGPVSGVPSGPLSGMPVPSGWSALATASAPSSWPRSATNRVATSCACGCGSMVPPGWSPASPAVSIGCT